MIKFEVTVAEFLDQPKYRKRIEEHYWFKNYLMKEIVRPIEWLQKFKREQPLP